MKENYNHDEIKEDFNEDEIQKATKGIMTLLSDHSINRIDHIGIAVSNLDEGVEHYGGILGLDLEGSEEVAGQKVRVAKFQIGGVMIELLQSTDPEGPIAKFIEKRGEGIHHIAFGVGNIDRCLEDLKTKGVALIDQEARIGVGGSKIAFIHPRGMHGVLMELVERT